MVKGTGDTHEKAWTRRRIDWNEKTKTRKTKLEGVLRQGRIWVNNRQTRCGGNCFRSAGKTCLSRELQANIANTALGLLTLRIKLGMFGCINQLNSNTTNILFDDCGFNAELLIHDLVITDRWNDNTIIMFHPRSHRIQCMQWQSSFSWLMGLSEW